MVKDKISQGSSLALFGVILLSGANGLVMEIVFRRQLLLSLGVEHYSVGTVLTVFMAGLALGSFVFGRLADKTEYPLRLYGTLEIGVGLAGLLLITVFSYLDPLYVKLHMIFGKMVRVVARESLSVQSSSMSRRKKAVGVVYP